MIVKPSVFPYVEMCPYCEGTGTHWYNPDYPMGDCGERAPEPCLNCNERGWLVPSAWTAASGTSAGSKDAGGSSDHSPTQPHGSLNT